MLLVLVLLLVLVDRGVNWNSVRAVATHRSRWRTLGAHCPVKDRRI